MANGAQLVTAHEKPAAAITKLAVPTLLAIHVPKKRRKAKKAFEMAQRSGRESQVKGIEGRTRFMTSRDAGIRPPYIDRERAAGADEAELDIVATSGGRRIEVASETTECQSSARVPARVAAARKSSLAEARSVAPLTVWLLT
jgi:hypothetical protein